MHPIELGLAFLEGLALIVSPCILPMLPLVLATSIDGGRARPFGIIVGFVAAFTAFAYLSRELVQALDINTEWITNGSLVLLALFGFILLSERLSDRFSALTGGLAQKGQTLSANAQGGFGSGLVIGALIGLVWTPCAGPILAAVLVQVIRQESDISALAQLAAFAFGAGVPMLIIALMGRQIMGALGFLSTHAVALRKGFGVLILLAVAFIASGWAEKVIVWGTSSPNENEPVDIAYPTGLREALDTPYPAPPLEGITTWLNSQPLTLEELQGKVVLIDFWTYSCINCIRTFPYITQWHEKYKDDGLVIIGVHAPEFEFEKRRENVEAAIAKHGITYPVAMDNSFETWLNYENRYWPAHYLINKQGEVVYTHFGEGKYSLTEHNIRTLLELDGPVDPVAYNPTTSKGQTHETYLGYGRAENMASPEGLQHDAPHRYSHPNTLPLHHWALEGGWQVSKQHVTAQQADASLKLHFLAGNVFLVMGTQNGEPVEVSITLNGEPLSIGAGADVANGMLTVNEHRMYRLVEQDTVKEGVLEITASQPGLEAYAFTFGR